MYNLYFLLLILCANSSLHSMIDIGSTTPTFVSLPDEIKITIIKDTGKKEKNETKSRKTSLMNIYLSSIGQTISSLRLTNKSFNNLLSNDKMITLFAFNKKSNTELNSLLSYMVKNKIYFFADLVIKAGANVNYCNKKDFTPFLQAIHNGDYLMCELLIAKGANVNYCTGKSATPLLHATCQNKYFICNLLLRNGADVNKDNIQQNEISTLDFQETFTPLHVAIENKNPAIIKLLISHDADISRQRIRVPLFINKEAPEFLSPFALAKEYNHTKDVLALLKPGHSKKNKKENCLIQ